MSILAVDAVESLQSGLYGNMPGIRTMGLDVGATKVYTSISNNVLTATESGFPSGTTLALHLDETFEDLVGGIVVESNVGVTFSTSIKKFGTASAVFNSSSYLQYADAEWLTLGAGDFYFDMWIRFGNAGAINNILGHNASPAAYSTGAFYAYKNTDNTIRFNLSNGTSAMVECISPATADTSNFHHLRFGRAGSQIFCALDGVVGTGVAFTGTPTNATSKFCIGRAGEVTLNPLSGYIDEFVFIKGVAMNTTNFSVPTTPYGSVFNGYLLKSLTRLNLDRITFPKIYKPANTKCQVDVLGASIRANTATAGGNTTITLDASASAVDGFYVGNTIVLKTLTGTGQSRVITDYVGSTKVATVSTWTTNPANLTTFEIFQTIQSNISPGFDFSTIDYTTYPTINVICSLERQSGATATPSMGIPLVTSIEKSRVSQAPIQLYTTTTGSWTTLLSASGSVQLDGINISPGAASYASKFRVTIDGILIFTSGDMISAGASPESFYMPLNIVSSSTMLVEVAVNGATTYHLAYSK